ncbi:hypothetical protein ACHAXR_013307 [Thalassiosira sp. AJA248-18]
MFHNTFQNGVISILTARGSHPLQLWERILDQESQYHGRIRRVRSNSSNDQEDPNEADMDANDENKVSGPSIELLGTRLSQNYIICPTKPSTGTRPSLGITLPYLYLTVHVPQNLDFSFEVTILDDRKTKRRFRASTYQSTTVIKPDIGLMPLNLERRERRLARDSLLLPVPEKKQKIDSHAGFSSYGNNSGYYGPGSNEGADDDGGNGEDDYCNNHDKVSCWNRLCLPLAEYTRRTYGTRYVETICVQIHANCQLKQVYFSMKGMNEDDELPEEFRLYYRPTS